MDIGHRERTSLKPASSVTMQSIRETVKTRATIGRVASHDHRCSDHRRVTS
jgi:hypothetical protein